MRVVFDGRVASDHFPGIGRVAVNLAEALVRVAPDLDLIVLEDTSTPSAQRHAIAAERAPVAASVFSVAQQWVVPARLRALGADLYHSLFYLMPYRPGVPSIFTLHDLIPLSRPELFPAHKRMIYAAGHRLAVAASRAIVTASEASASDLTSHLGVARARIDVVSWGVEQRFAPPGRAEIDSMRAALGIPDSYFLFVGSNRPHKNLPRLVEAYARARRRLGPEAPPLVVAGPWDPRYPEARERAQALGPDAVHFIGMVPDTHMPALYGGALVFVFPSLFEGFGLPVLEAMACGTAVITSAAASMPEITGDAAWLVPPEDSAAMEEALVVLASDSGRRDDLAARARARAAAFTWERTAEKTAAIYRRVLGQSA